MSRSRGFTLVDMLAVLAIAIVVAVLLLTLLPRRTGHSEGHRRVECRMNLKGIGTAIEMYAISYNDQVPILPDIDQSEPVDYAKPLRLGAECTAASLGTGAQQNLCLLIKDGTLNWEMFLCPSVDEEAADRASLGRRYGLGEVVDGGQVSYIHYALQIPYAKTPDGINSCPWTMSLNPNVPIMADRGPRSEFRTRWSPNHRNKGEVVLFPDTRVVWSEDARGKDDLNTTGYGWNNIYTADKWDGTPDAPKLLSNGTENKTPTDPNGTKDSVLYHRW